MRHAKWTARNDALTAARKAWNAYGETVTERDEEYGRLDGVALLARIALDRTCPTCGKDQPATRGRAGYQCLDCTHADEQARTGPF